MHFSGVVLALESPLHIGAGRGGMVLRGRGFVPGHVLSYALAAAMGKAAGGTPDAFAGALRQVQAETRCGPLLILDPGRGPLLPRVDRALIESRYLVGRNQVTLDPLACSAVDSALFEVESISPRVLSGTHRGESVRIAGGIWHRDAQLGKRLLKAWLSDCLLGGELKTGLGRVRLDAWHPGERRYAGRWAVDADGLSPGADETLPGPCLDGGVDSPLEPWIGRLHDPVKGFGQRFSGAALIRMDARCPAPGHYLPATGEVGLGCWSLRHGD